MTKLSDVILRGAHADRPSAGTAGRLYFETDTLELFRDNGSAWQSVEGASGSGGNVTSTGAAGSEPGSPSSGDLYLPSNAYGLERYSGSAWAPWGPIFPLTDPSLQTWAWVNQGGATVTATKTGIALVAPADSGPYNFRIRKKSAPSTPYTITAALLLSFAPGASNSFGGLLWRESSSGKLVTVLLGSVTTEQIYVAKWNSETSFSATYANVAMACRSLIWVQIADDGTNRTVALSADGQHFAQYHTVGHTDFITPDEVGFFANSNLTDASMTTTLVSWKES
jgi:hypothetical protein